MFGEQFEEYKTRLFGDTEFRNLQVDCPLCGQNVQDRTVTVYQSLIDDLYTVYKWCGERQRHEFAMKDIRHILGQVNYTRFGDLVRFGGIVYKLGKAQYGINMARAKEFFAGQRQIPVQITLNQLTNEIIDSQYVDVHHFPKLTELLTKEGLYDPHKKLYEKPKPNETQKVLSPVAVFSAAAPSGSAVSARPQTGGTLW